jgi:membrane protein involved in colicin uptake
MLTCGKTSSVVADIRAAQQVDCEALERKNSELSAHFLEKAKTLARQKKMYDTLKGRVMASHVAVAAGDEAEMTLQTVRATDRFADRMPGVRTGTGMYGHPGGAVQQPGGNRLHNRQGSGSSVNSGQQRGGIGLGPASSYSQHLQGRGLGGRVHTGRKCMLRVDLRPA